MTGDGAAGGLEALFQPRGVAVVGASADPAKAGNALLRALLGGAGADGPRVYPVNPTARSVEGAAAYPSVADLPVPADLAVLAIPAAAVPDAVIDCAEAGVKGVVVCAGGFGESGGEGAALQSRLTEAVRHSGVRLLGPNTSGFLNPHDRVFATFMPAVERIPAGPVAVVAQSGGVNLALAFLLANGGLGVRLGVGLGNAVDVGFADVLRHLRHDPATKVVALHVEGFTGGREVYQALRELTAVKPVVALAIGRADVGDFSRSHTGALATGYAVTRAAIGQAGAVLVDDLTGMVDAVRALAAGRARPARRPGIGVVTGQAGPGLLIADALGAAGLAPPPLAPATVDRLAELLPPVTYQRNPVDTGRPGATFPQVLRTVAEDPAIDALAVYALDEPGVLDPVAVLTRPDGHRPDGDGPLGVPVLYGTGGTSAALDTHARRLASIGVPLYRDPDGLARGVRALAEDARAAWRLRATSPPPPRATRRLGPAPLDEARAKDLLDAVGLRTLPRLVCASRAEAHAALDRLGGPVVVKILDVTVTHKSDVGGVHVGVRSPAGLDRALDAIDAAVPGRTPRYLVEQQASPGVELIVGGLRDTIFGPTVLLGLGGVDVELAGTAVVRLAPLAERDAEEMVDALPPDLFTGHRGRPPVPRRDLADMLAAVGRLMTDHTDLRELDLNPVRATPDGLRVLDALVVLEEQHLDH